MGVQKAIFVAWLCVFTYDFHVPPQEMSSSKDSKPEQSPTHSAEVDKKPGMLRSKVGLCLSLELQPTIIFIID